MKRFPVIPTIAALVAATIIGATVLIAQQNSPEFGTGKDKHRARGPGEGGKNRKGEKAGQGKGEIKMPTPAFRTEVRRVPMTSSSASRQSIP